MEDDHNAVRGRRSSDSDSDDLGQAFSRIPQDLGIEAQDFRVIVLGSARKLHPLIRDEVYHIGREALVNAFRHARATCIEVELEYAPKRFRIVVRDNGCGAHDLTPGHGLVGMRERAVLYGGRLETATSPGGGFTVHAVLPVEAAAA